ncbi:hypothetical protein [Streptomyces sp. NPDC048603]|uniref:hypothetical protein n=1 Tax=Streptomyces sp. NPDC048603 TaxID=3365577 RepID=UPI003718699D
MTARPAHRAVSPAECGTCAKVLSVLGRADAAPPTGAALAAAVGLRRRATLVHVAHLVQSGLLEADGRTPTAPPAPAPVQAGEAVVATPHDWATTASVTCRQCGRLLLILATLAGREWSVQVTVDELARALGITDRPTREHLAALTGRRPHRAHTQAGPLLRTERIPGTAGAGGLLVTFLSGRVVPGSEAEFYTPEEYEVLRRRGLALLNQAPVADRMNSRERVRAADLLLIPRLHLGYPDAELLASMSSPEDTAETAHTTAYGLIKWRLDRRAPLTAYVPTAQSTYDPTPRMHDCVDCEAPIRAPLHVLRCGDCRRRERAGISIEIAEAWPITTGPGSAF